MSSRYRRLSRGLAAAVLVLAACDGGGTDTPSPGAEGELGGTVSVIGTWGGAEQESFLAMVAPWEEATGVTVEYTGTRDINAVLTTGVASGILPDLAGLPGPGQMAEFAAAGALVDLGTVLDVETYTAETSPGLVDLGMAEGKIYGIFIKSAVKGLIWYNPNVYTAGPPTSFDDMLARADSAATGETRPWCVALESGAASGWPGTDWIEDILLRQAGPDVYDNWVAGQAAWTSPEVRQAFETFGQIVADENVYGGSDTVLTTAFGDGGNPLFTDPPGCVFHHQASFITDFFVNQGGAQQGDFDFYPFPDINTQYAGSVTGAGDLFGMFNDTPQARSLMQYLVTAEAQSIWVERGGALSANRGVTTYPDEISQRSAEILVNSQVFRFDGSDLMPEAMNNAFWKAVLDFTKNQPQLDSILQSLDEVQATAYEA